MSFGGELGGLLTELGLGELPEGVLGLLGREGLGTPSPAATTASPTG